MRLYLPLISIVAICFAFASVSKAQDEATKQQLIKALQSLAGSDVSATGSISEEDPEDEKNNPIPGVQRVVISSIGGGSSKTFTGDFELLVSKDSVAIVSKDEFPGIKVLRSSDKVVNIQAHAEAPYSVDSLSSTLKQLVDWKALSEAVEKSPKIRVTKKDRVNSVRVVLDTEFITVETIEKAMQKKMGAAGAGANVAVQISSSGLSAQIVDLVGTFLLNEGGAVEGMTFDIQYNDPMKAMMSGIGGRAGGVAAIRIGGGNTPKPVDGASDLGKLVSYSFKLGNQPTERIKQFVKTATPYLQSQQ